MPRLITSRVSLRPALVCFLLLSAAFPAQAFFNTQLYQAGQDSQGLRFGWHNENPDFFWRTYVGLQQDARYAGDYYPSVGADWVIPVSGTLSTLFIGPRLQFDADNAAGIHAGLTLFKVIELGWQRDVENRKTQMYAGLNWSF
ncbi:MAG: hypothetical protein LRY66_16090 [Saccharospirillaceae bacterium]|nr:hypothetical protein [Saccharospirillaceae bacterium]MCD8532827.1 hypothetical protein [Saccharospirillaceae bacterium]